MKNDLTLNIGTRYNGEGLKKLDSALKSSARVSQSATKALGSISGELGQMSGAAGKAASAVSGLFSALAAGGPAAMAVAAVTAAVGLVVKAFNDAKQRAKDFAQTLSEYGVKAANEVKDALSGIRLRFSADRGGAASQYGLAKNIADVTKSMHESVIRGARLDERAGMTDDLERSLSKAQEERDVALDRIAQMRKQVSSEADYAAGKVTIPEDNFELKKADKDLEAAGTRYNETQDVYNKAAGRFKVFMDAYGTAVHKFQQADKDLKEAVENREKAMADVTQDVYKMIASAEEDYRGIAAVAASDIHGQEMPSLYKYLTGRGFAHKQVEAFSAIRSLDHFIEETSKNMKDLEKGFDKAKYEALNKAVEEAGSALKEAKDAVKAAENAFSMTLNNQFDQRQALDVEEKKVKEAYEEAVKSIEKQKKDREAAAKKEQEAAQKKAEQDRKSAEAEADRIRKQQLEEDRRRGIENLQMMRERLADQEKKSALQRLEEAKKEQAAAKALAEAERKAAEVLEQWKQNRQNPFERWNLGQKRAAEAERDQKRQEDKNVKRAADEARRLAGRIFRKDGTLSKRAGAFDIGRFAEQADYLGFENVSEDQLAALNARREQLRKRLFNDDGTLRRGVSEQGRDMGLFRQLDGALKKNDAVQEAARQKKAAEDRERRRAINEDRRTQALQNIDAELKDLIRKTEI